MRDWAKTLRPASFRGVPFKVETDDGSGGRRLAVHEYGGGERSTIEDMGRKTPAINVTAYLIGDVSDAASLRLAAVMNTAGPALLVLPAEGGLLVHPEDFQRSRARDRAGYFAFDLSFIPVSVSLGSPLTLGDVAAAFSNGLSAAQAGFSGLFS